MISMAVLLEVEKAAFELEEWLMWHLKVNYFFANATIRCLRFEPWDPTKTPASKRGKPSEVKKATKSVCHNLQSDMCLHPASANAVLSSSKDTQDVHRFTTPVIHQRKHSADGSKSPKGYRNSTPPTVLFLHHDRLSHALFLLFVQALSIPLSDTKDEHSASLFNTLRPLHVQHQTLGPHQQHSKGSEDTSE
ncbi:hypothetical protein Ancab_035835 [Ancistrocladus abbreviatus]